MKFQNRIRRLAVACTAAALVSFSVPAFAQDVSDSHLKAARDAVASINATDAFDAILPQAAASLQASLIQKNPDLQELIGTTVSAKALAMASRRADLEREGYLLAICTNKYEANSLSLIEALGLSGHFSANCGQDTFPFRKPDPRHLTETILKAGGDPRNAIMVGDSRTDIDTAKAAGIPVIAVDFGYTDRHVREFDPSVIVSHFDEITVEMARRLMEAAR